MRVVVDAKAWTDLDQIGAWIAKDNPRAAREVLRRILETTAQLQRFPRLARQGRVRGTHERLVAGTPYIIVFELLERTARVSHHRHRARPPRSVAGAANACRDL